MNTTVTPLQNTSERWHERLGRFAYTVFAIFLLPFLMAYLLWRSVRSPGYLGHWPERFLGVPVGFPDGVETRFLKRLGEPGIRNLWIHAVSVGETRACAPLIERWLSLDDRHVVTLTHTTPTGRQTGREMFTAWLTPQAFAAAPRMLSRYLPYDYPWANALFLAQMRPAMGVLMETELWPNLIAQSWARRIPLVLINARLSARSSKRLHQFFWLARPALARLSGIAAQTPADAERFGRALHRSARKALPQDKGPAIVVAGNMKFDLQMPSSLIETGRAWRAAWPHRHVWLAASTRDDEESAILAAWKSARDSGDLAGHLLVIVPRHPERFDRVARLIETAGLGYARRSHGESVSAQTDVWLGDSLGEMFAYLQASDLVLMGGSLLALGGQNPIEACAVGKPVFFGPHMFNFFQIARELQAAHAGGKIESAAQWIERGRQLLSDSQGYAQMSARALEFAQTHRGATVRTEAFLDSILSSGR